MQKKRRKTRKSTPKKDFRFSLIDWLFVAFGIVVSFVTLFSDCNHSAAYIAASIFALNCGILEIILNVNGRRSSFVFSTISAIACIIIAFTDHFYGNMVINIYYIPLSIVGFYLWGKHSDKNHNVVARRLTLRQTIILIIAFTIASVGLGAILTFFGGDSIFIDSMTTILVIISSVLMILRYRENWLVWIVTDTLLFILFINAGSPAVIIMRLFSVLSSIYGYINWRKLLKK